MLLSACLIVKNEAFILDKCLSSLEGVVDEIIVVDTGSTDQTVEIAKKYTDQIFHYEWDNNFANARNESLRHANGKYILVIDADEYFDDKHKEEVRPFLETNEIAGGFLTVNNFTGSFNRKIENTPVLLLRIIRKGYYYSEAIHEQLDSKIFKSEYPIVNVPGVLSHIGYMTEIIAMKNKKDRNMEILEKLLNERPEDSFQRLNFAAEFIRFGDFEKALELVKQNYQEFDIFNQLQQGIQIKGNEHLVARNYKFYIVCLYNLGRYEEEIEIAKEALSILPMVTDYIYFIAVAYNHLGKWHEAKEWFVRSIKQGDMKVNLYEMTVGAGGYMAYFGLASVWGLLGDEQLARKYFLRSFFEQPMVAPNIIFALVYLFPKDEQALFENIESKIIDIETYHVYAEAIASYHLPSTMAVIERAEKKYGKSPITERARLTFKIHQHEDLDRLDESQMIPYHHLWLGLYYANQGLADKAREHFQKSEDLGQGLWVAIESLLTNDEVITLPIVPFARDLVAMNCTNLFVKWAPYAPDIAEAWPFFSYSPFADLMKTIDWPGDTVHQCEHNALKAYTAKDFTAARQWLDKALDFHPTVTKVLLDADLFLALNRPADAIKILAFGRILFEESPILENALMQLTGTTDALSLVFPKKQSLQLEDLLMVNPYDAYRRNMVNTMPLNMQLAQLHQRGALLTKEVKAEVEKGDLQGARNHIQELEEILTFLRSCLNPELEVSVTMDEAYLFYYKILVHWFLSPKETPEEFDAMVQFWESWAQTWTKAPIK